MCVVDEAIHSTRRVTTEMRPGRLDELGLVGMRERVVLLGGEFTLPASRDAAACMPVFP